MLGKLLSQLKELDFSNLFEDENPMNAKDALRRKANLNIANDPSAQGVMRGMLMRDSLDVPNTKVEQPVRGPLPPTTLTRDPLNETRPRIALDTAPGTSEPTVATIPDKLMRELPASTQTQNEMNQIFGKDYSIKKDAAGNVTHRGADRDKNFSTMEKIGNFFSGLGEGGIIGGVKAGMDRNYNEKQDDQNRLMRLMGQQQTQYKAEDFENNQLGKQIKWADTAADNAREDSKYILAVEKFAEAQEFQDWKMEHGDKTLSERENFNKWRIEHGNKIADGNKEWRDFQRETTKARLELSRRGLDIRERGQAITARGQNIASGDRAASRDVQLRTAAVNEMKTWREQVFKETRAYPTPAQDAQRLIEVYQKLSGK